MQLKILKIYEFLPSEKISNINKYPEKIQKKSSPKI